MPTKPAAFKAMRQGGKRADRNNKVKSDVAALIRKARLAVAAKDAAKAQDWLKQAIKKIDKAAQKGVLKKNNAARKKSRLARAVNGLLKK
ncbi:MAG: 30S ribosomal protein S20 [Candidatus Buchananbacteria bacterium RIFCSPHIGHO2_02_FULL_45_11b]|uniref:Small ribosomal subunit protein bS20 n=4 Tax=Candidatus Buchananiibacteriota TaxID=1817903 RepID=A0A1G1YAW7_9BACT|nr:MAG: 30S ribosomal protein S20 [Candidatus Buchananbacteria bacterium RIFCSPHIGHO2_01_FULL_46_12]OGY50753.1 MAG: 30S ribosomal protein S20 [Candidatus Buchananbacteria bacterium RIFCSPHIGHO2_02_FULL_45_11b]OGY53299.1 MAG: 30S ribosomal protein S20 [Candidatus Buchananbacteria bacterium RIFCSPLOWO2_01_FULL_45_31]OGY55746.1 MAG: 30S ribosomal protein S20 [Candidatus Buchananbacteria bacterium RIFCSPLOWO2_02_FULL_46_11b]